MAQDGAKTGQDGAKMRQDGAKMAQSMGAALGGQTGPVGMVVHRTCMGTGAGHMRGVSLVLDHGEDTRRRGGSVTLVFGRILPLRRHN